jgi:hypothetical protein
MLLRDVNAQKRQNHLNVFVEIYNKDNSILMCYAPVVAWATVWLFLILSLILEWETVSIDFASAFVQAPLTSPIWIHLPKAF